MPNPAESLKGFGRRQQWDARGMQILAGGKCLQAQCHRALGSWILPLLDFWRLLKVSRPETRFSLYCISFQCTSICQYIGVLVIAGGPTRKGIKPHIRPGGMATDEPKPPSSRQGTGLCIVLCKIYVCFGGQMLIHWAPILNENQENFAGMHMLDCKQVLGRSIQEEDITMLPKRQEHLVVVGLGPWTYPCDKMHYSKEEWEIFEPLTEPKCMIWWIT